MIPSSSIPFSSIWIQGMGMMGASLALSLRPIFKGRILGSVRSEKSASHIRKSGMCDEIHVASENSAAELISKLPDDSLVVIGMPVRSVPNFLSSLKGVKQVITDMSSTRLAVQEKAAEMMASGDLRFVGSHPICGSEDSGPAAGKAGLFENRLCIMTQSNGARADDVSNVESMWRALGMNIIHMEPKAHDLLLGYLSHAPHILAGVMAHWGFSDPVKREVEKSDYPLTGGGFRDMVRIAGSNPEMWLDILRTNDESIRLVLTEFRDTLDALLKNWKTMSDADWMKWLAEARFKRNKLSGYPEDK